MQQISWCSPDACNICSALLSMAALSRLEVHAGGLANALMAAGA